MRKDSITSDFAMMVSAAITFFTVLLLLVCLPVTYADKPTAPVQPDRHTSEYVRTLEQEQRRSLRKSLSHSLNRFSVRDNPAVIPDYQVYHSIFLDILINPLLAAGLTAQDLALIRAIPAQNDRRFVRVAQDAMAAACKIIKRANAPLPATVNLAVNGISKAQEQVERQLNSHYQKAMNRLSKSGKELVEFEYDKLIEQDGLIYTRLDLDTLGFAHPEFVFAFLQDSCENAERLLPQLVSDQRTLQDQLEDDYQKGAIQLFQHQ